MMGTELNEFSSEESSPYKDTYRTFISSYIKKSFYNFISQFIAADNFYLSF